MFCSLIQQAKKVLKQSTNSQDSLEKRRRSLQNAVIKSSSTKKTRNTHELKLNSTSSIQSQEDKVANDVTDRQATNESQDITTDAIDVESEMYVVFSSCFFVVHLNTLLSCIYLLFVAVTIMVIHGRGCRASNKDARPWRRVSNHGVFECIRY